MNEFQIISKAIQNQLDKGNRKFAIFPYGEMGCLTKRILEEQFGITDFLLLDNMICRYNHSVFPLTKLEEYKEDIVVLFVLNNMGLHEELIATLEDIKKPFVDVFEKNYDEWKKNEILNWETRVPATKCGKYSYGPLCNHIYVEKVGNFCSFAHGATVVPNHAMNYVSTHPFLTHDSNAWKGFIPYQQADGIYDWYIKGIEPKGNIDRRRITIGNDVWIGENAIITNYSNIGDGVIVGAGAVITKNVPDYAVVVGCPARIVRYRYTPEQIVELKKIKWWDWPDEKIVKYQDDFYETDIGKFILKHGKESD